MAPEARELVNQKLKPRRAPRDQEANEYAEISDDEYFDKINIPVIQPLTQSSNAELSKEYISKYINVNTR